MRAIGAVRESLTTEESVSVTKQGRELQGWADRNGHELIELVEDKSTSGAVPPDKREKLGPWLTDDVLFGHWDVLACAKLDRLSRSTLDFAKLLEWCRKHGKTLVSLAEGYDFTTPEGELMATNMVAFAQFERRRIGQRRAESGAVIRAAGRWDGGRIPFGYVPEKRPGGHWLILDAEYAPVVWKMVADVIGGKGLLRVAGELNAAGTPTPLNIQRIRAGKPVRESRWHDTTVRLILTSPVLLGQVVTYPAPGVPKVVRDDHGKPVRFTDEPLIIQEQWDKLQDVIAGRSRSRGEPQARHMAWGVAFCRQCSQPRDKNSPRKDDVKLYGYRRVKWASKGSNYWCKKCGLSVPLDRIEAVISAAVLDSAGERVLREKVFIPGGDHAAEIARLEKRAERLRTELDDEYDEDLARSVTKCEESIQALRDAPHEPDRIEWRPVASGETVAEHWATLDDEGKCRFLREWGVVAYADRIGMEVQTGWLDHDSDVFQLT